MKSSKRGKLKLEAHALARCFYPHQDNNRMQKYATMVVFLAWGVIWLGMAFGYATKPAFFTEATVLVGLILGRMWGIEVERLLVGDKWHPLDEEEEE